MADHPQPPAPDSADAALRAAANRRIAVFVGVFSLLLAGALWLVLRDGGSDSRLCC